MDLPTLKRIYANDKTLLYPEATLRAVVPNKEARAILGSNGEIAQRIQSYGIYFNVNQVHEKKCGRLIFTRGHLSQLRAAWHKIIFALKEKYDQYDEGHFAGFSINFVLPNALVKHFLIEGEFERMAQESNTLFIVLGNFMMRSTEQVVSVYLPDTKPESLESMKTAVGLMAESIQKSITIALSPIGNVFYDENIEDNIYNYLNYNTTDKEDIVFNYSNKKSKNKQASLSS